MTAKGAVARSRAARRLPALPPSSHGPPNHGGRSSILADCGGTTNKALTRAFALCEALISLAPSAGLKPAHTAPEADALSAELRGLDLDWRGRASVPAPVPVPAGPRLAWRARSQRLCDECVEQTTRRRSEPDQPLLDGDEDVERTAGFARHVRGDRQSGGEGKRVAVRVVLGGRRSIKKTKE